MFLAYTLDLVEIIDVGEEGKPPKKKYMKFTNLLESAKIFGQHSFLGLKCYKRRMERSTMLNVFCAIR
jgi:hypothetical protein